MKLKYKLGITLLELVITIAVLGILASSVMIIIGRNSQGKTRDGIRKADLQSIGGAVNAYYFSNNNQFPEATGPTCDAGQYFCTSTENGVEWIPGLNSEMKTIPVDPKETAGAIFINRLASLIFKQVPNIWDKIVPPVLADQLPPVVSSTTDGYIRYTDPNYAPGYPDTSGTCGINTNSLVGGAIGQAFFPPYYTYRSYLAFDTANIPDNATITSVSLNLTVLGNNTTTDFILRARYFDWQNSLACADWVNTASGTIDGTYDTSGLPDQYAAFLVTFTNFSGINLTGLTQIMLTSDREENDWVPSGREDFVIFSAETPTNLFPPQLNVTYTIPPPPLPTADIEADAGSGPPSDGPITIPYNSSATISWTSNATSCDVKIGGVVQWSGPSNLGVSTGNLTADTIYDLTCNNGAPPDSVTVNVLLQGGGGGGPICPYRYETTANRQDFILWACLEIGSDEHIFNINDINDPKNAKAPCPKSSYWKSNLPTGAGFSYNFCFESR